MNVTRAGGFACGVVVEADQRALLAQLYRRHRRRVFVFLLRRTGDRERAEDLTQDVFLAAVRSLPEPDRSERSLLAWLYRVARHRWIDEQRRFASAPAVEVSLEAIPEVAAPDRESLLVGRLLEAIDELPEGYREPIVLKLFEGRPYVEIAERLGTSEAGARMRVLRALERLHELLGEKGIEP